MGESSTVKLLGWTEITKPMGYATELLGDRVKRSHAKESKEKSLGLRARASGGRISGCEAAGMGCFGMLLGVTSQLNLWSILVISGFTADRKGFLDQGW